MSGSTVDVLATTTTTPMNMSSGFASATELTPIVLLVVLVAFGLVSSARVYRWVLEASSMFARSFEYALKGVVTAIALGVFATPFYVWSTIDAETRFLVYQAIGAIVVGYVGLVALGVIGEFVWRRLSRQHERVTGKKPFASYGASEEDNT